MEADWAREFLATLLALPWVKRLLSGEHFSADRTLLKALAGKKKLPTEGRLGRAAGRRNGERNFRREKRSNKIHASTTDPDAKLCRKGDGQERRPCFMGHVLMENSNGLAMIGDVSKVVGTTERDRALDLVDRHRPGRRRITVGADKGYDVEAFIQKLRARDVTAHVAIDGHLSKTGKPRKTAADGRTLRHPGYAVSQYCRKRIEEVFGWIKTTGGLAQLTVLGLAKARAVFPFAILVYNLISSSKLLEAP